MRVEERLAELLDLAAPRSEGVAFDDVARRVRRRRMAMSSGIATAATLAVVVAAVSLTGAFEAGRSLRPDRSSQPATRPSVDLSGAAPSMDTRPLPDQPPTSGASSTPATDARPCTANDVAASFTDRNGAGGHSIVYVRFRNTSRSACLLKGYPRVTATEPGLPAVAGTDGSFFPTAGTANMSPGQDTLLGLETDTMCPARPDGGSGKPPYHHITIHLPGGGVVRLDEPSQGFDVTCGLRLTEFFVQS